MAQPWGPQDVARPCLKPALRRLWRDDATLQLGVDPTAAIVVGGLDAPAAQLVETLDGTHTMTGLVTTAAVLGVAPERVREVVSALERAGALDDGTLTGAQPAVGEGDRLAPDRAAASVVRGVRDGGELVMQRRRRAVVAVHGAGRLGSSVVTLLAAAGVGTVLTHDPATVVAADTAPGGAGTADLGTRRQEAATRAARRVAADVRARLPAGRSLPDLAVLTPEAPGLPALAATLMRDGVAHLVAQVRDGTGVVGPLVLPGRTSCLRCHDLYRADRDPSWPQVAAQLAGARVAPTAPCDIALAAAVAAQTVLQALAHLDGGVPLALDGTLEIAQADGRTRRRGWPVHPLCGCDWVQ